MTNDLFFWLGWDRRAGSALRDRYGLKREIPLFLPLGDDPSFRSQNLGRGDQIFFSATCPGQVACKNPLVLRNFLLVPKYFSNRKSIGQVANTTISLPLNQSCR